MTTSHYLCCDDTDRTICGQRVSVVGDDNYSTPNCTTCISFGNLCLCPKGVTCHQIKESIAEEQSEGERIFACGCTEPCECEDCIDCGLCSDCERSPCRCDVCAECDCEPCECDVCAECGCEPCECYETYDCGCPAPCECGDCWDCHADRDCACDECCKRRHDNPEQRLYSTWSDKAIWEEIFLDKRGYGDRAKLLDNADRTRDCDYLNKVELPARDGDETQIKHRAVCVRDLRAGNP